MIGAVRARVEQVGRRDVHVVAHATRSGSGRGMHCVEDLAARSAPGPGARPRCRRGRRCASRCLSARTLPSAASLAAGSFLIGICAAMPPIACAPRRWQVLMQQLE